MPQEPDTPSKRDAILAAAAKVFDTNGYAATTMEAVAVVAGVAKGSIYNHFKSKEDLFSEVFSGHMKAHEQDARSILDGAADSAGKLSALLDMWFSRFYQFSRMSRLVLEFWAAAARQDSQGRLSAFFSDQYRHWRCALGSIIQAGQAAGQFRAGLNTGAAASLILAVLDGIGVQSMFDQTLNVDKDFLAALKRAITAALTAGPVETPQKGE